MFESGDLSYHIDVLLLIYKELINIIVDQHRAILEEIKELWTRLAKAAAEARQGGSVEHPEARGRRAKASLNRLQTLLESV